MKYEVPSYEIVILNTSDVITASPGGGSGSGSDFDLPFVS